MHAQILPWLRTLAFYPDYRAFMYVLPSTWTVFSMAAKHNSLTQAHGHTAWGPNACTRSVPQQGSVQQLEWAREQEGEAGGDADTHGSNGEGDDPIED